ncbi:hypothetical protein TrCOL_g10643 [Triparma columacea]|uniref:Uncharacterized protein n=1 Tax=Triparma columacea TaxID=722753 RepID=A0A9W7L7W3_9STRA|nr:hypothetical protein TrCOL_g10643 [Triparma columacea]
MCQPRRKSAKTLPYISNASIPSLYVIFTLTILLTFTVNHFLPLHDSTFVPGLGFSGFWYTFGRINSLSASEYASGEYYCFSAGCLAVSARFLNKDVQEVARTALDAQGRWRSGNLTRYEVATDFVDTLLSRDEGDEEGGDEWLEKVKVITTSWYGLMPVVTQAKTREELKGLLIKTSFIPFATGFGLAAEDGEMDGGFSMLFHPRCKKAIYLPVRWDMFKNILNVNMGMETVERLYAKGLEDGRVRRDSEAKV